MNFINELVAKASIVDMHRNQLDKLEKRAVCPSGYILTAHYHYDELRFSIHGKDSVLINPLLSIIGYQGMTRVSAYILVQEFKSLNS